MKRCVQCKGLLERVERDERLDVAGRTFIARLPAYSCSSCGEVLVSGALLARFELAAASALAQEGPIHGESFRFLRKALGMRAMDLAALLGVTPETVSRWESGKHELDRSTWATVGALVLDHLDQRNTTQERLRALLRPLGSEPRWVVVDEKPAA